MKKEVDFALSQGYPDYPSHYYPPFQLPNEEENSRISLDDRLEKILAFSKQNILSATLSGNATYMTTLLCSDYIYPQSKKVYVGSSSDLGKKGSWSYGSVCEMRGVFDVRPFIEGLFIEEHDTFVQMIINLQKIDNQKKLLSCYHALQTKMQKTDLNPDRLFAWNEGQKYAVNAAIDSLNKLKFNGNTELDNTKCNLVSDLEAIEVKLDKAESPLDIAILKANFVQTLHKHDDRLARKKINLMLEKSYLM